MNNISHLESLSIDMAVITRKTVRSVALPAEHGSWSFWLEPVLLAMIVAPSSVGFAIVILSFASFMIHQPLKIALIDLRKKKVYARTRLGIGLTVLNGLIALLALLASLAGSHVDILLPLIPAYGIALAQIWIFDIRGESRHWLPETLGAVVMSAFSISIALAGGWSLIASVALASIAVARGIPTIAYVRTRIQQIKTGHIDPRIPIGLHIIATLIITALAIVDLVPKLTALAIFILLSRAIFFLKQGAIVPPKKVGFQELAFGTMLVSLSAIGYIIQI